MRSLRVPPLLFAVPLLGIARLFPEHGFGLWLRLAAATLVLLAPGRLVARALGLCGAAPALAWSAALVAGALAFTFAVGGSLDLTLALVLVAGLVALCLLLLRPLRFAPLSARRGGSRLRRLARLAGETPRAAPAHVGRGAAPKVRGRGLVVLGGLALGGALWFVESAVDGDALFHLGRIRKLVDLGSLSLHDVGEFQHGGLHPGYAFPLWHAWLGLVAKLAGVDPTSVVVHESSLLAPLALVLALEMGIAVFRSQALGLVTMLAQLALICFAPGHGGAYSMFTEPGTAARQLFVPSSLALFFLFVRQPSWPVGLSLAAIGLDLSLVHPTYSLFLGIPLVAFVAARALLARGADLRAGALALLAGGIPTILVFVWLKPIVDQTLSITPGPHALARSLHHYAVDLVVHSPHRYYLQPEVVARTGAVAVAALVLVPLALLARERRWSALVLGGTVLVLALELSSFLFPHFADAVSLSQARRASGFVPFAFAFAGGAWVLAQRLPRPALFLLGLGIGIWLQVAYPGDFGLRTPHNGPGITAWIALFGGAAALVAGAVLAWLRPLDDEERTPRAATAALAAALFVVPVAVHGFANWTPTTKRDAYALSPGLVHFLQHDVPARSVVFGDLETSYRAVAFAPVYTVAAPPAHVANTRPNHVRQRRAAVLRFFARGEDLAIPRGWGAQWLILRHGEGVAAVEAKGLRPVYADGRFVVFSLRP